MAIDKDVLFHFENMEWGEDKEAYRIFISDTMDRLLTENKVEELAVKDEEAGCKHVDKKDAEHPPGVEKIHAKAGQAGLIGMNSEFPIMLTTVWYDLLSSKHSCAQLCQMLTDDAIDFLHRLAPQDVKDKYVPMLMSGEYKGGMVMTEEEAGSDVGGMRTRAEEIMEGEYKGLYSITGRKHMISNPDAHGIIMLARDADTFKETKGTTEGLSAFFVPKFLDGDKKNNFYVSKLENKLGIHASATGTLEYEGAIGYLIGEKGKGMKHFFNLMNFARLAIATQALGISQAAFNYALEYSDGEMARKQFGKKISEFPAVANMLVNMKVNIEASRSLVYAASQSMHAKNVLEDKLKENPKNEELQKEHSDKVNKTYVLVCLSKYYAPKLGEEVTSDAVQVLGGYGYMEDYPVARHFRDMKITDIYEGTGQIQANKVSNDVLKGRFDDELENVKGYLENRRGKASKILRKRLKAFDKAVEKLRNEDYDNKSLNIERVAESLAEIYACYLLIKQSDVSERKGLVAYKFAVEKFLSPPERILEGESIAVKDFEKIVYYKE